MSQWSMVNLTVRSDIQVVGGGTAAHCNGLVLKQLASVGAPTWDDVIAEQDWEKPDNFLAAYQSYVLYDQSTNRSTRCVV